jgi:putative membrane protein insertion efficiency factor
MTRILIGLIRLYQRYISAWLPPVCRFHPTCSEYAAEAMRTWGLRIGGRLVLRRLLRCHPFHPGGYDPVPRPTPQYPDETRSVDSGRGVPKGQVCR